MEKTFSLPTTDNKTVYGTLNGRDGHKRAIIILHGLTGKRQDYLLQRAAHIIPDHGYDLIRISLYDGPADARALHESTLRTHVDDLTATINYFKERYDTLFAAGHSYGGTTLISALHPDITALSLWDPAICPRDVWQARLKGMTQYNEMLDGDYLGSTRLNIRFGRAMVEEGLKMDRRWTIKQAAICPCPVQVIDAGNGPFVGQGLQFHQLVKVQKTDHTIIKEADHNFFPEGTAERLSQRTIEWFDKF